MSPRTRIFATCKQALASQNLPIRRCNHYQQSLTRCRPYSTGSTKPPHQVNGEPVTNGNLGGNLNEAQNELDALPQEEQSSMNSTVDALGDEALEQILYGGRLATSDRDGGLTSAQEEALYREGKILPPAEAEVVLAEYENGLRQEVTGPQQASLQNLGHKFDLPQSPWPADFNHKSRYHPILHQISRLMMRDGKLSVAQRNLATVMNQLRTSPAPIYSPKFPLLPGTPPASHLPLNPILYLTIAIDSVAPLIRIRRISGAAGGGRALEMPDPIALRTRRRTAFQWILDVVNSKPSKGSGRKQLPVRIADEVIAVIEGRSSVWEKRRVVHKIGTAARANVGKKINIKNSLGGKG